MDLSDRLDQNPEAWKPKVGDKVIGIVVELGTLPSKFPGGDYPLVVLATDDGGYTSVHCFHTVLKSKLARKRPEIGDKLGLKYLGIQGEKKYEDYNVEVERAEPVDTPAIDWEQVGADAKSEFDDGDVPPPGDTDLPPEE